MSAAGVDGAVRAVTLENAFVVLEPLADIHRTALKTAALDERIWTFTSADGLNAFDTWFDGSLANARAGDEAVWAVRLKSSGELVGSTRYLNIVPEHARLEVGYTWYHPDHWAGPVNPSCKLLLFGHGFETLDLNRIELKTDARNARSRAAIRKLGATEEGTLRRHMVVRDGFVRDTVMFSVVAEEWPAVRSGLEKRLEAFKASGA